MGLDRGYGVEEVRVTHAHKVGVEDFDETETYSKYAHASLIFAIFHYAAVESSELLREKAVHHGKKSVFRWLRKSMRHPVKFARFVTKVTRWVRWIKIIGPVIGTSNKLLGNTVDLVKRIRQRRIARTAARLRSVLWNEMSEEELREHAAILIQKTYRAMRSRKAISALQLIKAMPDVSLLPGSKHTFELHLDEQGLVSGESKLNCNVSRESPRSSPRRGRK